MKFWTRTVALACSVAPSSLRPTSAVNASAFVVQVSGSARSLDTSSSSSSSARSLSNSAKHPMADPLYPGTAVTRMMNVRARVEDAVQRGYFQNLAWPDVRRQILWAGGLRDFPDAIPGQGYTGHSFNDFNHVDLTCMNDGVSENENDGAIKGIAIGNRLGPGIRIASLEEVGPGGSWSTCALGCQQDPPQDVAHIQFRSRIAFKLVWVPTPDFDEFVLVDDEGKLLAHGKPTGVLPALRERRMNYQIVQGSKYASEAENVAKGVAAE